MKRLEEWYLLRDEYLDDKIGFDCIEEFVEGLIDELDEKGRILK